MPSLGTRLKEIRLRLWWHAEDLGLPLVLLLAAALFGVVIWLMAPAGPVEATEGRIISLGFVHADEGSSRAASVRIDNRTVRVRVPVRYDCRIGDRIMLRDAPTRFGRRTTLAPSPAPCSRG